MFPVRLASIVLAVLRHHKTVRQALTAPVAHPAVRLVQTNRQILTILEMQLLMHVRGRVMHVITRAVHHVRHVQTVHIVRAVQPVVRIVLASHQTHTGHQTEHLQQVALGRVMQGITRTVHHVRHVQMVHIAQAVQPVVLHVLASHRIHTGRQTEHLQQIVLGHVIADVLKVAIVVFAATHQNHVHLISQAIPAHIMNVRRTSLRNAINLVLHDAAEMRRRLAHLMQVVHTIQHIHTTAHNIMVDHVMQVGHVRYLHSRVIQTIIKTAVLVHRVRPHTHTHHRDQHRQIHAIATVLHPMCHTPQRYLVQSHRAGPARVVQPHAHPGITCQDVDVMYVQTTQHAVVAAVVLPVILAIRKLATNVLQIRYLVKLANTITAHHMSHAHRVIIAQAQITQQRVLRAARLDVKLAILHLAPVQPRQRSVPNPVLLTV